MGDLLRSLRLVLWAMVPSMPRTSPFSHNLQCLAVKVAATLLFVKFGQAVQGQFNLGSTPLELGQNHSKVAAAFIKVVTFVVERRIEELPDSYHVSN